MTNYNFLENQMRGDFDEWFRELLHSQPNCFKRGVLEDCKEQMWMSWKRRDPADRTNKESK